MQQHFRLLGWFMLVLGVVGMVKALIIGSAASMMNDMLSSMPWGVSGWYVVRGPVIMAIASFAGITSGAGLLQRRPWARAMTAAASIIALPWFPFWTALGVYGLWVMFSAEGVQAWKEYVLAAADRSA